MFTNPFLPPDFAPQVPGAPPEAAAMWDREPGWRWWTTLPPEASESLWARYQARVRAAWGLAPALAGEDGAQTDKRFAAEAWRTPYFAAVKAQYQAWSDFMFAAVEKAELDDKERSRALFFVRQHLDAIAPTNSFLCNPNAIAEAIASNGESVKRGLAQLQADAEAQRISMTDFSAFEVGKNIAITPGSVVFRNQLIELIQYAPTTNTVFSKPLLIVPPCINKFYILDLQPENSFVRHAIAEGHTVFIVSWRNVPAALGALTWDDYLRDGALAAISAVKSITKQPQINALGFCVGGTILSCAMAVLAAQKDESVASATLLTTLVDFREPGEIQAYLSEGFLKLREPDLLAGGRLKGKELANAFASLRANELIWFFVFNNYLLGRAPRPFDLLFWNADSTNLPGPMYVYYLREFYLRNRLIEPDVLSMLGHKIDLRKVNCPKFVVATKEDHIVPWRSGFSSALQYSGDTHFVLGGSGHIAGIVNPPAKNQRQYWAEPLKHGQSPEAWHERATEVPGSWWPHWHRWLAAHGGKKVKARATLGSKALPPICTAPGTYVLEKA